MPLTGYRIVHVDAYSYRLKFTVKDAKPKKPKAAKKAPGKRKKKPAYNFATPSTGRRVTF